MICFLEIPYALSKDDVANNDYGQIKEQIRKTVLKFDASCNPVRELLDDQTLQRGASNRLREVRDTVIRFQTDLKACNHKISSNTEAAKQAALKILDKHDPAKLPPYSLRELFDLVRDVLGRQALLDFHGTLGDAAQKLPYFREQMAWAKSRLGQTAEAVAEIEMLIEAHGQTNERCRLLGRCYKQQYLEEENRAKKKRALNTAIAHYETGLKLDLNDYRCALNLLVLYPLRNNGDDVEKAAQTAVHILRVCDHKEAVACPDKWLNAARLLTAFYRRDEARAQQLADEAARQNLAHWELALCIEFLESLVSTMPDADKKTFNRIIDDYKSYISIPQKEIAARIKPQLSSSGKDYEKFQVVKARAAIQGEEVASVVATGRETVNTAQADDYVVENQTGANERYIVSKATFEKRYQPDKDLGDGWRLYKPLGQVRGIVVDRSIESLLLQDDSFYISAPWKEAQYVTEGDMFVTTLPIEDNVEVYRIAQKEFSQTYRLIDKERYTANGH